MGVIRLMGLPIGYFIKMCDEYFQIWIFQIGQVYNFPSALELAFFPLTRRIFPLFTIFAICLTTNILLSSSKLTNTLSSKIRTMQATEPNQKVSSSQQMKRLHLSGIQKMLRRMTVLQMELGGLVDPAQHDQSEHAEEFFSDETASDDSVSVGEIEETMSSFYELERQPSFHGQDRAELMEDVNSKADMSVAQDSVATPAGPLIINGAASGSAESDDGSGSELKEQVSEADLEIQSMQRDVNEEFAFQRLCMAADTYREIHHFNWLGSPVFRYSATPAVISLLFLLSEPKVPTIGDEYRLEAIMRKAMVFVDPVFVYLNNGWGSLCLRGSELIRWATGRVFKFYTPNGHWSQDDREIADDTRVDDGNLGNYVADDMAAGNGFIPLFSIRSRIQWFNTKDRFTIHTENERSVIARHREKNPDYIPSPLRQSMTPDPLDKSGKFFARDNDIHGVTKCNTEIELERPVSRLSRTRSFSNNLCQLGGSRALHATHDYESESDTSSDDTSSDSDISTEDDSDDDDGYSAIDDFIQLSHDEREEAKRRKRLIVLKRTFETELNTIIEENESFGEGQKGQKRHHHHRIFSIPALAEPLKNLRHISNKARNALRSKDARISSVSKSSGSSESSSSASGATNKRRTITENIFEPLNYSFSKQYASYPTPHFNTSPKRLVTKLNHVSPRSSSKHTATAATRKKRDLLKEGLKEFWFAGFGAMGSM